MLLTEYCRSVTIVTKTKTTFFTRKIDQFHLKTGQFRHFIEVKNVVNISNSSRQYSVNNNEVIERYIYIGMFVVVVVVVVAVITVSTMSVVLNLGSATQKGFVNDFKRSAAYLVSAGDQPKLNILIENKAM